MTKISVTQQHFDDVQAKFAEAIGAFHENYVGMIEGVLSGEGMSEEDRIEMFVMQSVLLQVQHKQWERLFEVFEVEELKSEEEGESN